MSRRGLLCWWLTAYANRPASTGFGILRMPSRMPSKGDPSCTKGRRGGEPHGFVAALALVLRRTLEHRLAAKMPESSSTDALAAMKSMGIAELSLNGHPMRLVWGGDRDARRVLAALGIRDLDPQTPKATARSTKIWGGNGNSGLGFYSTIVYRPK